MPMTFSKAEPKMSRMLLPRACFRITLPRLTLQDGHVSTTKLPDFAHHFHRASADDLAYAVHQLGQKALVRCDLSDPAGTLGHVQKLDKSEMGM